MPGFGEGGTNTELHFIQRIKQSARQEEEDIQYGWTEEETGQRERQKKETEVAKLRLFRSIFMATQRRNTEGGGK